MSNETKHTPGPWSVKHNWAGSNAIEILGGRERWPVAIMVQSYLGLPEAFANTLLISKAPNMLKTLRELESGARDVAGLLAESGLNETAADCLELADKASEAIAAATGGESEGVEGGRTMKPTFLVQTLAAGLLKALLLLLLAACGVGTLFAALSIALEGVRRVAGL